MTHFSLLLERSDTNVWDRPSLSQPELGLTHELDGSILGDALALVRADLARAPEIDELYVPATTRHHDDVVRLQVEVHLASVVQELQRIQDLQWKTHSSTGLSFASHYSVVLKRGMCLELVLVRMSSGIVNEGGNGTCLMMDDTWYSVYLCFRESERATFSPYSFSKTRNTKPSCTNAWYRRMMCSWRMFCRRKSQTS